MPTHPFELWRCGGGGRPEVNKQTLTHSWPSCTERLHAYWKSNHIIKSNRLDWLCLLCLTRAVFPAPWGRADTGSQLADRRPRTSEEVRWPERWRRSSPEPAAAASAPLVDCPWTSGALPGSVSAGEGQLLITNLYCDPVECWVISSFHLQRTVSALAWVSCPTFFFILIFLQKHEKST